MIYDPYPSSVEVDGATYPLRLGWREVLAAMDVLTDEILPDSVKVEEFITLLCPTAPRAEYGLFKAICDLLTEGVRHSTEPPCMDLEQDAGLVYAAFRQAYGIDLQTSEMNYFAFRDLLQGLPSGTRLGDVIRIRTMDVPKRTKDNAKQIAEILRLKAQYALKKKGGSLQEGLARMFDTLKGGLKHG